MTSNSDWPALDRATEFPERIEYERGIWGKVHGAATDFRWIARSERFGDRAALQRDLNLSSEDVLTQFQAWRNTGDRCYAVSVYPSRAVDAFGRRGFLEKQVLEWRRPAGVPAAVGALLLLPLVAAMTDSLWWNGDVRELQSDSNAVLPIAPHEHEALAVSDGAIAAAIDRGRQALRDALGSHSLEHCYEELLSDRRPAYLRGIQKPSPPEALAALLLALPSRIADRISIAGWIPATRPSFEELGSRWDLIVTAPDHAITPTVATAGMDARRRSQALLGREARPPHDDDERKPVAEARATSVRTSVKPFRPGVELDLTRPPAGSAPMIVALYRFAVDPGLRWITAETLAEAGGRRHFASEEPAAQALLAWIAEVRDQQPDHVDAKQWRVKVDLLQSAAIVLVPEPSTIVLVRASRQGDLVPMLFFGKILRSRAERDKLAGVEEVGLRWLLEQSLRAGNMDVKKFLDEWKGTSTCVSPDVRAMIREAVQSHSQ